MSTNTSPIRLLIVDDEEELRDSLKRKFERLQFSVQVAGGGVEALNICRQQSFEVIITDVRMAQGSGVELIDNLKRMFGETCPAIICISAFSDLTLETAYAKGVDALLPKPIDTAALVAAVNHFHESRQQRLAALARIKGS